MATSKHLATAHPLRGSKGKAAPSQQPSARTGRLRAEGRARRFEHCGTWWFYPSYLETPPGPWQSRDALDDDPVAGWQRAISWMADHGLNFMISGIPSFCKDRVYHDWGYHYVCDFPGYPEARVFSNEFVELNREKIRAIFSFARRKGVAPYIHHYNFCAPVGFVQANESLARKLAGRVDGRQNLQDRLGYVNGNVCWSDPVYQRFLTETIKEFFHRVPEAEGIMITPGECANCPCPECTGVTAGERGEAKIRMLGHFVRTFVTTLEQAGKTPLVRAWATGLDSPVIQKFPRGVRYVIKYSVFDCIDAPPDPAIRDWISAGHRVWVSKEFTGGENAGPMAWFDPKFFWRIAENLEKMGVPGVMSIDCSDHGLVGIPYKVQQANLLMYTHYATRRGSFVESPWKKHMQSIFGRAGERIYDAVLLYARVPLNISKLVYGETEGFSWKFPYHLAGEPRWPGTLGTRQLEPPGWVRGRLLLVNDYVRYLGKNPWRDDLFEYLAKGREEPLGFLKRQTGRARRGEKILASILPKDVPMPARKELRLLQRSARLAVLLGDVCYHLLLGRIYYAGAAGPSPDEVRKKLALQCLQSYRRGIGLFRLQVESILDMPHDLLDFEAFLASARFWEPSLPNRVRIMEGELREIEMKLSPLVGEQVDARGQGPGEGS